MNVKYISTFTYLLFILDLAVITDHELSCIPQRILEFSH